MMTIPLNDCEKNIIGFMDKIEYQRKIKEEENSFENSEKYKLFKIEKEKERAKEECMKALLCGTFKKSLPLNDEYKDANSCELDNTVNAFIIKRCPKGALYYVHEGIKKGSQVCKKIMESVENIVDDMYFEKQFNVDQYDAKDLLFQMTDDIQKKIDLTSSKLELDDVSKIIQDNVKTSVSSEILRAKEQKEKMKELESELANDLSVQTESAIDFELQLRDINTKRDFIPSLFQGIMIGKTNRCMTESVCGEPNYNTLEMFGYQQKPDDNGQYISGPVEKAFIESVEEFTMLNLVKALRLESFTKNEIQYLAQEYAEN